MQARQVGGVHCSSSLLTCFCFVAARCEAWKFDKDGVQSRSFDFAISPAFQDVKETVLLLRVIVIVS